MNLLSLEGGRGGRVGWREGGERRDDCYTYSNGPQYLNSNQVTYYEITWITSIRFHTCMCSSMVIKCTGLCE